MSITHKTRTLLLRYWHFLWHSTKKWDCTYVRDNKWLRDRVIHLLTQLLWVLQPLVTTRDKTKQDLGNLDLWGEDGATRQWEGNFTMSAYDDRCDSEKIKNFDKNSLKLYHSSLHSTSWQLLLYWLNYLHDYITRLKITRITITTTLLHILSKSYCKSY